MAIFQKLYTLSFRFNGTEVTASLCTILYPAVRSCKSPKSGSLRSAAASRRLSGGRYVALYSYRSASAGKIREADHDGYSVATNDTPTATKATNTPSANRGANGT